MKEKGVTRFLESLGLTKNESNIFLPELRSINLRSNGNHSIDFRRDRLTFDGDMELIKIKEYNYKAINGIFLDATIKKNKLSFRAAAQNTDFPFRKPNAGDIVFVIKKSDNSILSSSAKISAVYDDYAILDQNLILGNYEYIIGYADPNLFPNASQDLFIRGLFMYYSPKTKFATDIYIDYFAITSFSTVTEYFGL